MTKIIWQRPDYLETTTIPLTRTTTLIPTTVKDDICCCCCSCCEKRKKVASFTVSMDDVQDQSVGISELI